VTLTNSYLEQGRYAEAIASTGAEPDLVDTSASRASFTLSPIALAAGRADAAPSPFGAEFADLSDAGVRAIVTRLGGGVALIDFDGDGDLDVFATAPGGQRLL